LRVIFAGTPEFAAVALTRLHAAGFTVPLVLTQPDRPAGRGLKLQASPVKQFALDHGIAVAQPRSLRLDGKYPDDAAAAREAIAAAQADVMVVAAYGLILPQWVLTAMSDAGPPQGASAPSVGSEAHEVASVGAHRPVRGCLNIHASLLPRWRGAAPIHRAIEAGDSETGITIMQMDAGLDTGDMLLVEKVAIAPTDTTARLHDTLATLGGRLIVEALELAACGGLKPVPQPAEGVTYAHKIEKAEALIDWARSAAQIERRIRAFDPFPGAQTTVQSGGAVETVKLWRSVINSKERPSDADNGQILLVDEAGIEVAAGDGVLRITELQRAGGKRLAAADFLRGFALAPGMRLGVPAG
jgi:methionyl-tRNA formyltransferase